MKFHKINFTSKIETKYADQVEHLFFFNKNQKRYYEKIEGVCAQYGIPHLDKSGGNLLLTLGNSEKFQTLYTFDKENNNTNVLGMIVYYRPYNEIIEIIHIAVVEECSEGGIYDKEMVVVRMIERLRKDALRLKGVKKIKLPYNGVLIDISKKLLDSEE